MSEAKGRAAYRVFIVEGNVSGRLRWILWRVGRRKTQTDELNGGIQESGSWVAVRGTECYTVVAQWPKPWLPTIPLEMATR